MLNPIKTEPSSEAAPHLYRFSPSPAPSIRYHTFQADVRTSPTSSFDTSHRQSYNAPQPNSSVQYHASPSSPPAASYTTGHNGDSYSDGGSYPLSGSEDGHYGERFPHPNSSPPSNFCPCRTSPATGVAYIALSQQLQTSLNSLRQFSHHPPNSQCLLYRRIIELNNLMQYVVIVLPQEFWTLTPTCSGNEPSDSARTSYDQNTVTDREEILSPLSASSGHTSFHTGSSEGVSPQEWNTLAAAGYNPYFPMPPGEQGIYTHVIT